MLLTTVLIASLALATDAAAIVRRGASPFPVSPYVSRVTRLRNGARASVSSSASGNSSLALVSDSQSVYANVTFGNTNYSLILDTGSSDTWIVETGFQCQDANLDNETESSCYFGPTYTPNNSFTPISNEYFSISYGDGEYASGVLGNASLTLAGVQVQNQEIALVNTTYWEGDNVTSGIMGLAYPALTSAYEQESNDPNANVSSSDSGDVIYSPIINTIFFVENLTQPIFSMALARNSEPHGFGGYFTLGGTPNLTDPAINASSTFATVDIQQTNYTSPNLTYEYYTLNVDGLDFDGKTDQAPTQYFVDSGTTLNYAPTHETAYINSLFDPPSFPSDWDGMYYVACNATAPRVGVGIGNHTFYMQPADLISNTTGFNNNTCYSGFQDGGLLSGGGGNYILGDVFMANTLVVFDLGKQQLSFSSREYYQAE